MFFIIVTAVLNLTMTASALIKETFDTDLGNWSDIAYNNTGFGDNDYGFSSTNNAGGASSGEAGGKMGRHPFTAIGDLLPTSLTAADTIQMKGTAKLVDNSANGHIFIGYFDYNSASPGSSTLKLGIDIVEPDQTGLPWRLYLTVNGSLNYGTQVQVNNNTVFTFDLTYQDGTFSGTVAGTNVSVSASLVGSINAFGMGTYHVGPAKPGNYAFYYVDDVEYTTPAATIEFETAGSGELESVSPGEVAIVLSGAKEGQTYTVDYKVTGGTADGGGVDYTLDSPGTITFNPGQTTAAISIDITDDGIDEDDESIILELSNPTGPGAILGEITQHTYVIRDPGTGVGFASAGSTASESISPANIQVCLSETSTQTVTVDYGVIGGTATPGGDYTLTAGMLTFSPGGGTCRNISVELFEDIIDENNETVVIELSNPVNAKLSVPFQHTLVIQDPPVTRAVDLKIDIGACASHIPNTYECDPGGSHQVVKEGFTDWTQWDPDLPGGEACEGWYESKTKIVGDITMVLERFGPCEDEGDYGAGLRFRNGWAGPLTGDGVNVNNMPNEDDPNPCGGAPELMLTITGIPEAASYNYQMTSWHNNIEGGGCAVGPIAITLNGSQVVSNLAQTTEKADDDAATMAVYEVPGGTMEFHFIASLHNVFLNGFRITDGAGASEPIPADGQINVEPDVTLGWTAGQYASTHQVYLSTNPDALQFQDHIGSTTYQPPQLLQLGTTYYWRIDEVNGAYPESPWKGPVWSFTTAGAKARDPNPADGETDVHPDADLSWTAAPGMDSHDVYFGTDQTAVANATILSDEFKINTVFTSFDPGRMDLGKTYYWRIDEIDGQDVFTGDVWEFTVHNGKAKNPLPPDDSNTPAEYIVLEWDAAPLATSRDVYFGTDETAVASATPGSAQHLGSQTATFYDYGPVTEGVTYYWRVDENGAMGTVKGDLWSFTGVAPVDLKVDMAVPQYGTENPIAASHKAGYVPWAAGRWDDLYMHDHVPFPNVGGTGITLGITGTAEGRSGLKCYNMCMDNKAGGAPPNGSPVGEPIANTWFTSVDRCAGPLGVEGSQQLGIYDLPASEYEVKLYHNLWEPSSDDNRECTKDGYGSRGTTDVHVRSLAGQWQWLDFLCATNLASCGPASDALRKTTGVAGPDCSGSVDDPPGPDCGVNVVTIQEAFDILPTSVQIDDDAATSVVRFWTDGSPVIIHSQTGEAQDSQYRGDRSAINAIEIVSIPPQPPTPDCTDYDCHDKGDYNGDCSITSADVLGLVQAWPPNPYDKCADFNNDGSITSADVLVLVQHWPPNPGCDPGCTPQ
jgi:hypothetical protein